MSIRSASLRLVRLDDNTVDISARVAFPESSQDSVRVEDVLNCFDGVMLRQAWLLPDDGPPLFIGHSGPSSVPLSATSVNRLKGRSGEQVLVGVDSRGAAALFVNSSEDEQHWVASR